MELDPKFKKNKNLTLNIANQQLQQVPSYKYLGVTLDSVLSYSNHITTILNTVSHKSYILSKISHYITKRSVIRIYKSMILPYFDYADIVFDKVNCSELEKLQRAQNRYLQICLLANNKTNTDYIHSITNTPLLKFIRKVHLRNYMYTNLGKDWLLDVKPVNTRLRDAPLFNVKKSNTTAYDRSVQHNGANEWNCCLSTEIRNVDHYSLF